MSSTGTPEATIARQVTDGHRRLSFPQERLFLLDRLMPGLPAYNIPTLVRVPGNLDADLLERSLNLIVARHEILRTTISLQESGPVAEVRPQAQVELTVVDLRDTPDPLPVAERLLGELARAPFDLGVDPLLRAGLVHTRAGEDLLLVVLHHIGSDHASRELLFTELSSAYDALGSGRRPALPQLRVQYADFAEWQRERLSGDRLDRLLAYWTDKLAGAPDRLELPTDRPRPSVQSFRGDRREFTIEAPLASPLRELARGQGASMYMMLMAAFNVLLHRYTGADDVVLGTPVSGRHYEEIAPLLGYFSNTLALRTDLSGDPTFAELLARVKRSTLEAQVHGELPFERLVEALNPQRALSHSPLFQVLLGFDFSAPRPPELAGYELEQLPVPGWEWARFDLSIVFRERGDGSLHADLEYATDLFDLGTIERLVGHLRTLLGAAARDPHVRISELPILTTAEQVSLLDWNVTAHDYDKRCLDELISEQAARVPEAIAVTSDGEAITYGELDRRANRLARELAGLGAAPGSLVGICLERSVDLVVAMLAVLKSGAAYVPIDPSYPPQRQEFMLADAKVAVLLTQEGIAGGVDPQGATVVCLDRDHKGIAARDDGPLEIKSDPERLAYVIYTSGSTGRPKGVEVTHRSVANLISHMRTAPGITENDVVANLTTPAFDLSVPDWYLPLTTGARLAIVPREATLDGVGLGGWLARTGATFVQATPTTWRLLVESGWQGSPRLKIVCGGEALPPALAATLLTRGAALWHMYGPTETTVWSSVLRLAPGDGPVALGGPIVNTTFHVLDANQRPVPIGVPGELYIGGDGLAVGYLERPELTAEKFIPNPFGDDRLYRTGDLVRWREDGTLEYLGRIDQQVKLRGFRIELGEIEAVLSSHPSVNAAVALVREDLPGDQRLVAYIVAAGDPPQVDALRALLKAKLPSFMVPAAFVMLDAFPVTANGKLDRRSLSAPDAGRPDFALAYAAPETPLERQLAEIWAEVLGVRRVGIDDDFFDLGGHSLSAVRMTARVHDVLGLELYLGRVFEHRTVRALAPVVSEHLLGEVSEADLLSLLDDMDGAEEITT